MKSWLICNFNEKTVTVKTGAIFKTHQVNFFSMKCPVKRRVNGIVKKQLLKILKVAHLFFCEVISVFMISF